MAIARGLLAQIAAITRPLRQRIANSIARGVVQLVDDDKKLQIVQLAVLQLLSSGHEDVDEAEHFQRYGFSSVPLAGAEAVVLFPNGDRGHPLVVAVDDRRHRPKGGQPGEVVVYTDEGDEIRLGRGHVITVKAIGGTVNVEAATVNMGPGAADLVATDGLVHGTAIDVFTGLTQYALLNTSTHVRGKK